MTKTRSAGGPILSDKFLNRVITLVIVLILGVVGTYGGYYLYNKRQMDVSARVSSISQQYAEKVRKNPLDVEARVNLAQALITEGNYDEAIKQLKEALKINGEHQGAIVNTGIAYLKKEDYKNAEKYFQKEVSMFGSSGYVLENKYLEEAYFDLAVIYWKKKNHSEALGYAAKATEIGRSNSDNHFLMGRIYLSKGSYDEAILKFQESLKFDPKFTDGHYGLAQAYEKNGDKKNAIAEYKQVLKLAPDFADAKKALDRLQ